MNVWVSPTDPCGISLIFLLSCSFAKALPLWRYSLLPICNETCKEIRELFFTFDLSFKGEILQHLRNVQPVKWVDLPEQEECSRWGKPEDQEWVLLHMWVREANILNIPCILNISGCISSGVELKYNPAAKGKYLGSRPERHVGEIVPSVLVIYWIKWWILWSYIEMWFLNTKYVLTYITQN